MQTIFNLAMSASRCSFFISVITGTATYFVFNLGQFINFCRLNNICIDVLSVTKRMFVFVLLLFFFFI